MKAMPSGGRPQNTPERSRVVSARIHVTWLRATTRQPGSEASSVPLSQNHAPSMASTGGVSKPAFTSGTATGGTGAQSAAAASPPVTRRRPRATRSLATSGAMAATSASSAPSLTNVPALAAATVATLSAHVGVFSTVTHRPPSARKGASARVRSVPSRRAMARPLRAHPDAGWSTSVPAPVFMSVPAPAAPAGRNAVSPASTETMVCAASATSIVGRDGDQTPHFRMRYASSSTRSASVRRCVKRRTSPTASPPLRW